MNRQSRQRALLAALVLLLALVAWRRLPSLWSGGAGSGAEARLAAAGQRTAAGVEVGVELPRIEELRLGDLQRSAGRYSPGRDPFRFGEAERPRPPAADQSAALRRALRQQRSEPPPKVQPASPLAPAPPPVDVVFLGSFGPRSRRLAVFSDGSDIFNALEGDVLKQKFVVQRIGYESADLGFVGFPDAPAKRLEIGG